MKHINPLCVPYLETWDPNPRKTNPLGPTWWSFTLSITLRDNNGPGLNGARPDPLLLGVGLVVECSRSGRVWIVSHTRPDLTYIH